MNGLRQRGVITVLQFLLISIIKIFSNATMFTVNVEMNYYTDYSANIQIWVWSGLKASAVLKFRCWHR